MSLSTNAISSGCFCRCCSGMSGVTSTPREKKSTDQPITHQDTLQDGALEGWRRELYNRFIDHKGSGVEFLEKYVPSRAPCPPPGDIMNVFAKFKQWKPQKGHEEDSYPSLLVALDALVSFIPADKRPSFMDCSRKKQYFPFSAFSKNHHSTFPDIAVSFPGKPLHKDNSPDWFAFSSIIEVKAESNDCPFRKKGLQYCKTLVQLAVNARNLMHAHGLTCTFVLGLYGEILRICRFDRSGAVICSPLNLKNVDDLKVARQFFWNFVHPTDSKRFVGWDPTVQQLDSSDQRWLRHRLRHIHFPHDTNTYPITEARSLQVFDGESGEEPHTYIAFRVLDVNGRLFSRATTVWLGIRDTRYCIDGRMIDPDASELTADDLRVRVIKEAWSQLVRRPEKDFYDRLDSAVAPHERKGLPTLVRGSNLGEREVRLWESSLYGAPAPVTDGAHHKTRLSAPASQPVSMPIPSSLSAFASPSNQPAHRPMQQTFTWRQGLSAEYWHRERSHVRFVVRELGRPVTRFRNTKELVMAFRDAIIGHRTAMAKGGILHRDISVGNILIVDDPALQEQFCGFIHDFDYSSMSRNVPQEDILSLSAAAIDSLLLADDVDGSLKERTGTFLFMAIDLLTSADNPIVHAIHHDLESFFWALLWVVIRHTNNRLVNRVKNQDRHSTCALVFKQDNNDLARMAKYDWLRTSANYLEFVHNSPLTDLIRNFALLIDNRVPGKSLDYNSVLELFDTALASELWPQANDGPLEYIPPDLRTVNEFPVESFNYNHRHGRNLARAGNGKEQGTTAEQDDDDYHIPWVSVGGDEPYAAAGTDDAEGDAGGNESIDIEFPVVPGAPEFDEEDWQDANDVSALLGHGDIDMECDDDDALPGASALSRGLQGLTLSHRPSGTAEASDEANVSALLVHGNIDMDDDNDEALRGAFALSRALQSPIIHPRLSETAEAGPSSASGSRAKSRRSPSPPPVWRRHAALPAVPVVDGDPPVARHPNTRAYMAKQAENAAPAQVGRGGASRSGPQTRSATRAGHSGGTRSEGGSQTGSRGSRRGR